MLSVRLFAFAAGSGYVSGDTIIYSITDVPKGNPTSFSVYLLTNDAHIKCFEGTSTKSPHAKNGSAINKYNITSAVNKGTASSKNALKVTAPGGSVIKTAERVTLSYTYVGGTFTAQVSIENPSSALTGIAFVGKDGSSHYYPVGAGDGTIDISALVRQAVRNAAGPGGSSSGGGASGGGSSGGSGSGGSSSGGGSYGPGGGSNDDPTGDSGSGNGQGGAAGGGQGGNTGGTGSSGGSGSGTGTGQDKGNTDEDETVRDHTQDVIDIKDSISDINSPSKPSDHNKGTEDRKPPCVLRRIWGVISS